LNSDNDSQQLTVSKSALENTALKTALAWERAREAGHYSQMCERNNRDIRL